MSSVDGTRATACDLLRSPKPRGVSRFLRRFHTDPHVFLKNTAVVTNPTGGVFFAGSGAVLHRIALSRSRWLASRSVYS